MNIYELLRKLEREYPTFKMIQQHQYAKIVAACTAMHKSCNVSNYGGKPRGSDSQRWLHIDLDSLRVHESPTIDRHGTTGYYMDHFCEETAIPLVIQFPSRKGKVVTLAAFKDDSGMVCISSPCDYSNSTDIDDCVKSTAHVAHSMAESYAEDARDHNAQQEAECQIDQKLDDIKELRAKHAAIAKELREVTAVQFRLFEPDYMPPSGIAQRQPSALCGAIRLHMQTLRQEVRRCIKRVKALRENYWLAVE
jgi:hypothetical protein